MKDAQTATFAFLTPHTPFQYASHIKSQADSEKVRRQPAGLLRKKQTVKTRHEKASEKYYQCL